jgi:hypothetical protein
MPKDVVLYHANSSTFVRVVFRYHSHLRFKILTDDEQKLM